MSFVDDDQIIGQKTIEDLLEMYEGQPEPNPLIGVSKVFARAIKTMNLTEWKTFIYTLMHIRWKETNSYIVVLDKMELAKNIGLKTDTNHVNRELKKLISKIDQHAHIEFDKGDEKEGWISGTLIGGVDVKKKGLMSVCLTPMFMPLFEGLSKDNPYITLWADDIFQMTSERSIIFYEHLRLHSDTRKTNTKQFSTRELKELFEIPKDGEGSYMSKDGHFQRTHFERYVIDKICKDLSKSQMIGLSVCEDGKWYRKIKNSHGNIVGYEFTWTVSDHPRVATGKKLRELREDPELLKIAKNIKEGKEKRKQNHPKKTFTDFEQHLYNLDDLEGQLLDNASKSDKKKKGDTK